MTTAADPLALGPEACYLFDETSGTTLTDASGNARHGTYSGGVVLGEPGLTVDSAGAAKFDGVDAKAEVAYDSAWMAAPEFSIVLTALVPVGFAGGYSTLVSLKNTFEFSVGDAGNTPGKAQVKFSIRTSGGNNQVNAPVDSLTPGEQVRIAATYDGATLSLYQDGTLVDSVAQTGTPLTGVGFFFASWDGTDFYQETLDEAAYFSRALTASEVAALGPAIPPPPPSRAGFGLVLDSSAVVNVTPPLDTTTAPPGAPSTVLHIVAPTVPVPTLVNGRPS